MKVSRFVSVFTASTLTAIGTGAFLLGNTSLVRAQATTFTCANVNGVPTTVAQTPQGQVPVIRWISSYFSGSGWTPQARCEEVSMRFRGFHQNQRLNYLTTGRMNNQNVVCVTNREGGACEGLLFTLKPDSNPGHTLQKLMAVRVRASGPLNESGSRIYINMEDYIRDALSVNQVTPPSHVERETPSPRQNQSDRPSGSVW